MAGSTSVAPPSIAARRSRSCNDALGCGELDPVVDAHDLLGRRLGDRAPAALGGDDGGQVGQVVLALGVVVADGVEQGEEPAPVHRHHAGVAERDRALVPAGLGGFDDARERAVRGENQAPVLGGVLRAEAQHRSGRASPSRRAAMSQARVSGRTSGVSA